MRLKDIDISKIKKLKEGSTFNDVKDIKEINDEIKDLDIYKETIGKNCLKYLKEEVVRTKEFSLNIMLSKCKTAKEARKKKARRQRVGRQRGSNQDARLLSKKSKEELDKEEKDKKEGNEKTDKLIESVSKLASNIFNELKKNNGDISKTIKGLNDKGIFVNFGFDFMMATIIAWANYFKTGEGNVYVLGVSALTSLGMFLYGVFKYKEDIAKLLGLLKSFFKKAKKKGLKFFGFGDADDDDDDDDSGSGGGRPTRGNAPEVYLNDPDFQNISNNIQDGGSQPPSADDRDPPSGSSQNAVLEFLEQQARSNMASQLKTARLETDTLLRQTNPPASSKDPPPPTEAPKTEKKEKESVNIKGSEYFRYADINKFKKRYEQDMADLRKEDKYKSFSDDDFYSKYNDTLNEKTKGEDLEDVFKPNNIHHKDNVPIRKQKAVILKPEKTGVGFLAPMEHNIDTGVGHTTPDTYWKTIQNYGESVQRNIPLAMTGMGLAGLAGASYYLGKANVIRDPQERNRIKELKKENVRLEGRERFLSDLLNQGMGFSEPELTQTSSAVASKTQEQTELVRTGSGSQALKRARERAYEGLLKSNEPVASKTQTLNPISHDQIVERQQQRRSRDEGQVLRPLTENLEMRREIQDISDEMSRMVGYMNEPQGIDI